MDDAPLSRVGVARALLAGLLVLGLTACAGDNQPPSVQPSSLPSPSAVVTESGVVATGLPDGVDLEVTDSMPGSDTGENLAFASQVFTLAPAGPLDEVAAMSVELNNALPANTPVVVATRAAGSQPWTYAPGRLSNDQQHVEYTTKNLGDVAILSIDLPQVVTSFQRDLTMSLPSGAARGTVKPTCESRGEARTEGYSVASTPNVALFWCFDLENDVRVVKVASRRLGPLQIDHTGATVITAPGVGKAFALWEGVLRGTSTLLTAKKEATFGVELEAANEVTLSVVPDRKAQSLGLLQAAVRALSLRMKAFGVAIVDVRKAMASLISRPQCANALTTGAETLLGRCLSPAKITQLLGSRAVLLRPLVTAPAVRRFFTTQGEALAAAQKAENQRIVVRRAAPDFKGLVGKWLGRSRQLTISRDGVVVENYAKDVEPIIDLTYRLGYPDKTAARTTVEATITGVKVNNRRLLNRRVPKIGDIGTLTLRGGVIAPPFLNTRYCDRAAREKGICAS